MDVEKKQLYWVEAKLRYIAVVDWDGKNRQIILQVGYQQKRHFNSANFTNVIHFRNPMHYHSHSRFRCIILNSTGRIGPLIQFTCSTFRWGFRRSRNTTTRSFTSVQSESSSEGNWSPWTSKSSTPTAKCPSTRQEPNLLAWSTTEAAPICACLRRFRRATAALARQVMQPFNTKNRPNRIFSTISAGILSLTTSSKLKMMPFHKNSFEFLF